jgi:hypothetical protein
MEKLLFFWPFAVLTIVGPWLLAREILGNSRWALVSPIIFAGNTYVLLVGTGQLTVAMGDVLGVVVLFALVRTFRKLSVRWAIGTGLLLSLQCMYEVRIAYLTVLAGLVFVLIKLTVSGTLTRAFHLAALGALSVAVFVGTQAYLWIPLVNYHGDPGLPLPPVPWIAFMTVAHGITGVHPFWTGGTPAIFRTTPLNPIFFVVPLLALLPIIWRRLPIEALWLILVALIAAFLIKQDEPPLGTIYDWMFVHLPGWNVFREASKLFFLIVVAYSVLIPIAARQVIRPEATRSRAAHLIRIIGLSLLALSLLLSAANFIPLERGELGLVSIPTEQPESFALVARLVDRDTHYGAVGWMGGAFSVDSDGNTIHRFPSQSERHPLLALTGLSDGDPFQSFCYDPSVSFCYLDGDLFPFLLERGRVSFVVAPTSDGVGMLPSGVSRGWLRGRLTDILGPGRRLGDGRSALNVWTLRGGMPVVGARGVALLEGGRTNLKAALPALSALGLPVVYKTDLGNRQASRMLPASVPVSPREEGGCQVSAPGPYAVFARSASSAILVDDGSRHIRLPRQVMAQSSSGWGIYGPVELAAGSNQLRSVATIELGPCVAWSPFTESLMQFGQPLTSPNLVSVRDQEVFARFVGDPSWVELSRAYDVGWSAERATIHLLGDGLFNLYYVGTGELPATSQVTIRFGFSVAPWQGVGIAVSAFCLVVSIVGLAFLRSRRKLDSPEGSLLGGSTSDLGQAVGIAGFVVLILAIIFEITAWTGVPSKMPWLPLPADPYGVSTIYLIAALSLVLISLVLRLMSGLAVPFVGKRRLK